MKGVPIIKMFKIWKNFDRVSPFVWIFLLSIGLFALGFIFKVLKVISYLGGFVLLIYILVGIIWIKSGVKK